MKNSDNKLIHSRIAARRYGIPEKWLKEQAIKGKVSALIAGNSVVFDANVLIDFLTEQAKGGQNEQ